MPAVGAFDVQSRAQGINNLSELELALQDLFAHSDRVNTRFANRVQWDGSKKSARAIIADHIEYNKQIRGEIERYSTEATVNLVDITSVSTLLIFADVGAECPELCAAGCGFAAQNFEGSSSRLAGFQGLPAKRSQGNSQPSPSNSGSSWSVFNCRRRIWSAHTRG